MKNHFRRFVLKFLVATFASFCFGGLCDLSLKSEVYANEIDEKKYETFRENLKLDYGYSAVFVPEFNEKNRREIDFSKSDEANELYLKLKEFLAKNKDVDPADFDRKMSEYVICSGEGAPRVLNRHDFEEYLNKNKNSLRLFYNECMYSDGRIAKAKECLSKKEPVGVLNEVVGGNFEDIVKRESTQKGVKTTNCVEVADNSCHFAGPWRFWVCSDLAIDRSDPDLKIVDRDYIKNLVAIIKYVHPDEFGFVDIIDKYFDEGIAKKNAESYKNFSELEKKVWIAKRYMRVPTHVCNSSAIHIDELYKKHIGMSEFDYDKLGEDDRKKFREAESACKELHKDIDEYDRSRGFRSYEDSSADEFEQAEYKSSYYVNKSLAAIGNESLLAKLLGYSVLFSKYNVHEGELSELGIAENPDNGEYVILDRKNVVVCCEPKVKERVVDGEGNYVEKDDQSKVNG